MADFYITKQGETWDQIALEVYGSEKKADILMKANYDILDTLIFSAGTVVYCPDLPAEGNGDTPPWVGEDTENEETDPYA